MDELQKQQELLKLLKGNEPEEIDRQKLRYALYARKSTQGDEKQASSIEDQVRECMDRISGPQGLNVVRIYEDKFSAKVADTRDAFKQLIQDIKSGKIDGLIAWHPDRLSRNMKEAGTIIDFVDRDLIKDLQFPTFTFENTPAGKMLLGITFVMAKQYSEHLSESVNRGNRRAVGDGEFIGKFKHGYIIDTKRHFQPDQDSFTLVKQMFDMALAGKSQKEIRLWINDQDYKVQKRRGFDSVPHTWSKDDVSDLLRDPHYAGIHKWGKTLVNLNEYYDFEPLIEVDDFLKLNKVDSLNSAKILTINRPKGGNIKSDFLRQLVHCGGCNQSMTSHMTNKRRDGEIYEYRYYYRCDTIDCRLKGKSAKARLVIDEVQKFFSTYFFVTESNYDTFVKNAKVRVKQSQKTMDSEIASLKVRIGNKETSYENLKKLIREDESGKLKGHYDLDAELAEIERLRARYDEVVKLREGAPNSIPEFKEYLKLFQSTPVILGKIRDMKQMDAFIRIFFSNFTITATEKDFRKGSEVSFKLKEPWAGFLDSNDFVRGAGKETLTPGLILGKDAL